ncbi:unnamed protein product [Choristocarpus tenellus]
MYRNALFRRLRLPHRFQALVRADLLGLKNLSPHYQPSRTDVYAFIALKRPEPRQQGRGGGGGSHGGHVSYAGGYGGGGEAGARRWGRETAVTGVKRLLPSANGQASQQSRWGAAATFRFALPEGSLPHILHYGSQAFRLVLGEEGAGAGSGQGPPRSIRVGVWRKHIFSEEWLGEVEVPLNELDDREPVEEWVPLRGEKGAAW